MGNVRRWYIYLVSAISLQAVAWAVIILLRHLVAGRPYDTVMALAWQLSLVIIGLPIYLVHWLWAQRLSGSDVGERSSLVRRLYLYGMLAGFLAPFATDAYSLLSWLVGLLLGSHSLPQPNGIIEPVDSLAAMAVTAIFWFYHRQLIADDDRIWPLNDEARAVQRLYILGFSAAGLLILAYALSDLFLRIILQTAGPVELTRPNALAREIARLLVGLALWVVFWRQAARLFAGPDAERESVLRKIYLYAAVFLPALALVGSATVVLANIFQRLLGVAPSSGYALQRGCATFITLAPIWAYHARVLQDDANQATERPEQAAIRRIYLYLIAGIGLAAFLTGLAGDLSVLIRALARSEAGRNLQVQLAWYSAALIAGLPVWIGPWRQAQALAAAPDAGGSVETRSTVRRIYLYFYLFVATMTVLSSAVFIVSRLIGRVLGAPSAGNLVSQLGQAIAFSLIGVGLWLYHGAALRRDNGRTAREAAARLAQVRVMILDRGEGGLGQAVGAALGRRLPALQPSHFNLDPAADGALPMELVEALRDADIIIGPWTIALPGVMAAQAVAASRACKVLIPVSADGWLWVGVEAHKTAALIEQAAETVARIAAEGRDSGPRRLGPGGIIAIIVAGLALLPVLIALIGWLTRSF
jgi:hypothetical protein